MRTDSHHHHAGERPIRSMDVEVERARVAREAKQEDVEDDADREDVREETAGLLSAEYLRAHDPTKRSCARCFLASLRWPSAPGSAVPHKPPEPLKPGPVCLSRPPLQPASRSY